MFGSSPPGSAESLLGFIDASIAPGCLVHTDGWRGHAGLPAGGYRHCVHRLRGNRKLASALMPRVHLVIPLLKRWLLGTHQGAVLPKHLDYYLDEFTFRFNRRSSRSHGLLFFRPALQTVAVEPTPYAQIVHPDHAL